MAATLQFVHLPNLYYLMEGLTFDVVACAEVLDGLLIELNKRTRIPQKIVAWNKKNPASRGKLMFPDRGRLIAEITQLYSPEKGMIRLAKLLESKNDKETAPVAFFDTHSPSLDIPMRIEVPLRAIIKGGPRLHGSYLVYLHALITQDREEFKYYGVTKRGWSRRFNEHVVHGFGEGSRRLFSSKMSELIQARARELMGTKMEEPRLAAIVTSICAIGLSEEAAMDTEEYLVDKYSLASKHGNGLNMIPGGREGIRSLHQLSIGVGRAIPETEDRETLLDEYLKDHPRLGKPNPGVAEKWNDPDYFEAVVCARENRLSPDQVRQIRYLAAQGNSIDQIRLSTSAIDNGQVSRVLEGRTYARIK